MHISRIIYFLALGISLVCSAPLDVELLPRSGSINFEGCSAGEKTLINFYLKDMVKLAAAGAASTEVAPGTESDTYKAWWGSQSSEGLINERLNSRFEKLAGFLNNPGKDIYFNCGSGTGCTGTSPAGTDRSSQRIYLCPGSFWHMPMTRLSGIAAPSRKCTDIGLYRGTAAVLLHELTHAWFFTNDEEQDGKGLGSGYGHMNALLLAKENPVAARNNADSYAMWATGSYFGGIENWATNPNQICGGVRR